MKSEEFFREVDEELQRDRLARLWQRYGGLVVLLAVLLVLGTAAWVGWDAWTARQRAAEAQRYADAVAAVESEPLAAAERLRAFAAEAGTGYAALARLRAAEAALAAGDEALAVSTLEALAADPSADPLLRDLGALLATSHQLDDGDPAALRARLEPMAAAGAPFRYTARELLALLALRTGDLEGARQALDALSKEVALPERQRQRIDQLLAALGGGVRPS